MNDGSRVSQQRRFNCHDQDNPTWRERAELCAELVGQLKFPASQVVALADIGCGDQKLREALLQKGIKCHYQGYDLFPQSLDVIQFDLQSDVLPRTYDVVVLLGVIEYLEQLARVLAALATQTSCLVFSHVIRRDDYYTQARLTELGWLNHFTAAEIGQLVEDQGLTVTRRDLTTDQRTLLMACQSRRFPGRTACIEG